MLIINGLGGERLFEPAAGSCVSRRVAITRPESNGGKPQSLLSGRYLQA
ncbi:MAG: hypothetical protein AAFU64_19515 [Bacteroidota bacterium]